MTTYSSANLLSVIEHYLDATGTPAATFGREAINDPRLVQDMRGGRQLREATASAVLDLMTSHLERLIATPRLIAEFYSICERAEEAGVNLLTRTVLMPVPIEAVDEVRTLVGAPA